MEVRRLWRLLLNAVLIMATTLFVYNFAHAQEAERRKLDLRVGGSEQVRTAAPFKRVSIADPEVADVVVLSPQEIYVYGKKVGYTSVILWEDQRAKTLLDVVVALDATPLKEKLHELYPDEGIKVHTSERGIVLSGTVSSPEVVEQAVRLAQIYLPKKSSEEKEQSAAPAAGGTGRSGGEVVNLMQVAGPQQVMLEVRVAEVTRNWDREFKAALGLAKLGKDFTGAFGTDPVLVPHILEDAPVLINFPSANMPEFTPTTPLPINSGTTNIPGLLTQNNNFSSVLYNGAIDGVLQNPGSLLLNFAGTAANIFLEIDNFKTAFRFLETNGLARTLAEPRLVTTSGQEASFLAGGEFPIPVAQERDTITIVFKEFGVALRFMPVVLADGRISLRVAPSVSEITSTSVIPAGIIGTNFIVPNLSTRRLETNVEMYDGQTLALAGLLQDSLRESVEKVPGLGDLPILGALFRSSSFRQQKTDLLIAVTPHLVRPVKEGTIKMPGEFMTIPNRLEYYLEGRMEGKRPFDEESAFGRHDFLEETAPVTSGGLDGNFGYRPVKAN